MIRSKVAAIGAALILGGAGAALTAIPAHADNTYPSLEIANSSNSVGPILVKSSIHTSGILVRPGSSNFFNNSDGSVRVDPDPEVGYPDVDSTWWGYEGQGLDYCDPGEGLIDPPNYYLGYIKYNTDRSGC